MFFAKGNANNYQYEVSLFNNLIAKSTCRSRSTTRWKRAFFVCFIDFFCARFNRRSIKETKNALFHARSRNGPLLKNLSATMT